MWWFPKGIIPEQTCDNFFLLLKDGVVWYSLDVLFRIRLLFLHLPSLVVDSVGIFHFLHSLLLFALLLFESA